MADIEKAMKKLKEIVAITNTPPHNNTDSVIGKLAKQALLECDDFSPDCQQPPDAEDFEKIVKCEL